MEWIMSNLGTIIVSAILIWVVAFVIRKMIKDKKAGRTSCGCNCAHCAMAGTCHYKDNKPSGNKA